MNAHWTQYWLASRSLTSFAEGTTSSGYDGSLKEFWFRALEPLQTGAAVLDIGTGNGAVAYLAQSYSNQNHKDFTVHAADLADIDPVNAMASTEQSETNESVSQQDAQAHLEQQDALLQILRQITFHNKTPHEDLPFADNSLDLIMSSFAIEYGETERAYKEAIRVLRPGAKLVAIAHHQDSSIVKDSAAGAEVLHFVLRHTKLLQFTDELLQRCEIHLQTDSLESWFKSEYCQHQSEQIRQLIHYLIAKFSAQHYVAWIQGVIHRVAGILHNVSTEDVHSRRVSLHQSYHEFEQQRLRLNDQMNAALNDEAINQIGALILENGAALTAKPMVIPEHQGVFGYELIVTKNSH